MRKIIYGLVIGLGLGLVTNAFGVDTGDIKKEHIKYFNFTGKDDCLMVKPNAFEDILEKNAKKEFPYLSGITWRETNIVNVFEDRGKYLDSPTVIFFYNSLEACKDFNRNFDILLPYLGK